MSCSHDAERIGADIGLADIVSEDDEDVWLLAGRWCWCLRSAGARYGDNTGERKAQRANDEFCLHDSQGATG